MDIDDGALVERVRGGDVAAFEPLVEKYRQRVYRLAYNVLRNQEDAWDAAQDAFIKAYKALPSFRGQSAFYTWLFRIVMNVAHDKARSRGAQGRAFGTERLTEEEWERTMPDPGENPDAAAARAEQRARLTRALETLPEHHRAIIMLSDLEGLSYREIADVLSIPMGTVMSRLHNARKRLRAALGPVAVVLVLLASLLAPASAAAQSAQVVRFGARVLLASDAPPAASVARAPMPVDERLESLIPKLRQLFKYREYTSLERHRAEVPLGSTERWAMPGERQLEITPETVHDRVVRFRLKLLRGNMAELNAHIQAARGNPAVIGGPRHADGVLIIIVWANANPEPR
ncbi:MAG: sigma-70 family RNA polymerase sigma factor [Candidatus Rokubacteria bacterium]|nr:sigma-70 family RNA polymerase sigma factor [Candidatus Rokubacteria bacterium]